MKKNALSILPLMLLVVLLGCSSDKSDYDKAKETNSIKAYEEFVHKHPDSRFVEQAKANIDSLRYHQVVSKDSIVAYEEFIEKYPDSKFYSAAAERLEELHFKVVESKNTITSYKEFLEKYPKSKYVSQVQEKMKQLVPLKGRAFRELRGWAAEGKIFVEVIMPLLGRETINLYKFELRTEGKVLANCIGIVPPKEFKGGMTGMTSEIRDNVPLPIAALRPAKTVEKGTGSTGVNFQGFFYDIGVTNGLIVGQKLMMKIEGSDAFFLTDPSITYLLLSDGFRLITEMRDTKRSGFKVPLKRELSLLFVVVPLTKSTVELVSDEGISRDVEIAFIN